MQNMQVKDGKSTVSTLTFVEPDDKKELIVTFEGDSSKIINVLHGQFIDPAEPEVDTYFEGDGLVAQVTPEGCRLSFEIPRLGLIDGLLDYDREARTITFASQSYIQQDDPK